MHSWVRSLSVLAVAFGGVVIITLGFAGLMIPDRPVASTSGTSQRPEGSGLLPVPDPVGAVPGLGGAITVTGDREGSFRLTRGLNQGSYALEGGGGRISFEGTPVQVAQVSHDGLELFPDPGQCEITTGDLDGALGIGFAELRCDDLVDIRGNGTVSLSGEIGLPLDLLTVRTLPPSGGSLAVGDETWTFEEAILTTWQMPAIAGVSEHNLRLTQLGGPPRVLGFIYDFETHRLSLATAGVGNQEEDVPEGACSFDRTELGQHNPQTIVIELSIDCPSVEVPGMGSVPISGVVVVDELQWPE
jgi:hypothetical protein